MTIYIVFGSSGEYSDRREWPVKAFRDEDNAKTMIEILSIKARVIFQEVEQRQNENYEEYIDWIYGDGFKEFIKEIIPEDPDYQHDYDQTRYYYVSTELV